MLVRIENGNSKNNRQEQLEELNQKLQDQIDVSENAACNLKAIISENEVGLIYVSILIDESRPISYPGNN